MLVCLVGVPLALYQDIHNVGGGLDKCWEIWTLTFCQAAWRSRRCGCRGWAPQSSSARCGRTPWRRSSASWCGLGSASSSEKWDIVNNLGDHHWSSRFTFKIKTTICVGWEHKKLKLGARNILVQTKCSFGFGEMTLFRHISEPDKMHPHLGCPVSNGFTAYSGSKI